MKLLLPLVLLIGSGACHQGTAETPNEIMGVDVSPPPKTRNELRVDHLARMKAVIRLHAAADYYEHCGIIDLPDDAFIPIEVNGDELPELAVAYGRAVCASMGATGFSSTGGSLVQFWWAGEDSPVRLLAEAHMLGFTPGRLRIETLQHGAECGLPGAAGCIVTYRWATPIFGGAAIDRRRGGVQARWAYEKLERPAGTFPNRGRSRTEQLARMRAAARQDAQLS